jgi:hypothetical protein
MSERKAKPRDWFRMYAALLEDPKAQNLKGELFKTWVNVLCIARRGAGLLPSIKDMAFTLRLPEKETSKRIVALIDAGLIDRLDGPRGKTLAPHNWESRQYGSDCSTNRVEAFRERQKEIDETANETFLKRQRNVSETVNETFHSLSSVSESGSVISLSLPSSRIYKDRESTTPHARPMAKLRTVGGEDWDPENPFGQDGEGRS